MATENILIKFTSDNSGIKSSQDELVKLGKITEDDAKKLAQLEGIAEGVADALKEAGVDAKNLNKQVTESVNSGKSLRTQFSEAKNEAVKLSKEFGAFSKEAREAAKRAALIKDEIADLNANLDALNPEAKLNAFVNLGQGIQGAFQVATGALQVFGVENERITKLAQQFQGVLNLTQGINSVLQLKDVYTQLRLVLGVTTTAQNGLNASMATTALAAAPLVAALAVLAVAFIAVENEIEKGRLELENFQKRMNDLDEASELFGKRFNELLDERLTKLDFEIKKAQARGASEKELLQLTIRRQAIEDEALSRAISSGKATVQQEKELISQRQKNGDELELNRIRLEQILKTEQEIARVLADQAKNKFDKINPLPSPQQAVEDVKELMDVIGVEIETLSTDLPQLPFFSEQELQQKKEDLAKFFNEVVSAYSQVNNSILALNNQLYQNDLENLKESRDNGYLTEKQYNDKVKALREKQFEINKKAQIAQAIIGTAQGIINALATTPPEAVPAAIALATTLGALNLARIIAVETPQFKEGTLNVGGGKLDADGGMHAVIHRGEAVIPKDRNEAYHPTVRAIFNKQIKASDINAFVQSKLSGKIENRVSADIDVRKLSKAFNRSNQVELSNAKIVGKILASELSKNIDIRRW